MSRSIWPNWNKNIYNMKLRLTQITISVLCVTALARFHRSHIEYILNFVYDLSPDSVSLLSFIRVNRAVKLLLIYMNFVFWKIKNSVIFSSYRLFSMRHILLCWSFTISHNNRPQSDSFKSVKEFCLQAWSNFTFFIYIIYTDPWWTWYKVRFISWRNLPLFTNE